MLKITLKIEGMMCGMCEAHANKAINDSWKVKKVTSSHNSGETVIITGNEIQDDALTKVIEDTGFKVLSITREPYEKKGLFSFKK